MVFVSFFIINLRENMIRSLLIGVNTMRKRLYINVSISKFRFFTSESINPNFSFPENNSVTFVIQ